RVEAEAIREQAPGGGDQGCLLLARPLAPPSLGAVVAGLADREQAVVLLLDRVQDPHNLGSCLRTAACFGAAAVVVPRRRAAALTPAAVKAASGAAERLPVVAVGSLLDAAERLRGAGFWLYAAEEGAPRPAWEADLTGRVALILGGEGGGVRQSLLRAADATLHLAPPGPFATLNVAAATAALLYEAARQRAVDLPRGRV
ncbi:MAG: RNA methyltransferase, partial [Nitrospirae bacterium]